MVRRTVTPYLVLLSILIFNIFSLYTYSFEWQRIDITEDEFFNDAIIFEPEKMFLLSDKGVYSFNNRNLYKLNNKSSIKACIFNNVIYISFPDGIYKFEGNSFKRINNKYAADMIVLHDNLYFFNHNGFFAMDSHESFKEISGFPGDSIRKMNKSGDSIFIFDSKDVYSFDGSSFLYIKNLSEEKLIYILKKEDLLYAVTENKIYNVTGAGFVKVNDIDFDFIKVKEFKEDLYFLTENTVYIFQNQKLLKFFDNNNKNPYDNDFYDFYRFDYMSMQYILFMDQTGDLVLYNEHKDKEKDRFITMLLNAEKAFYKNDLQESESIFDELYKEDNDNFRVNLFLGRIKRARGFYYEALQYFTKAISIKKDSDLFIEFAGIELELNNNTSAYNLLLNALKYSPDSKKIYVSIIENLMMSKKYEEALFYIDESLKKFNQAGVFVKNKLICLKKLYRIEFLENYYKEIIGMFIEDNYYIFSYIDFLIERFKFTDAMNYINTAEDRFDNVDDDIQIRKVRIMIEQGKYADVEEFLKNRITKKNVPNDFYILFSYLYIKINRFQLSRKYLSAATRNGIDQENWLYNYIYGYIYYNENRIGQAMKHFQLSLEKNPDFPYTRYYLADIYGKVRLYFSASRQYKILLDYWPDFEYAEDVYKKYKSLE